MIDDFVYIKEKSYIFDFTSHSNEIIEFLEENPHKLNAAIEFYTKRNSYFVIKKILEKYGALNDCIALIVKFVSPKSYRIITLICNYMMNDLLSEIQVCNRILHYFRLLNRLKYEKNINYWILHNIVNNSNLTSEELNILDVIINNNIDKDKIFDILEILYFKILYSNLDKNKKYYLLNKLKNKNKKFYYNPKYNFHQIKNQYEVCNKQQAVSLFVLMVSTGIFMYYTKPSY